METCTAPQMIPKLKCKWSPIWTANVYNGKRGMAWIFLFPGDFLFFLFMFTSSLNVSNNARANDKMSLKLDSAYKNCFWIFNSTHKQLLLVLVLDPRIKFHAIPRFSAGSFPDYIGDHLRFNFGIICDAAQTPCYCPSEEHQLPTWRPAVKYKKHLS